MDEAAIIDGASFPRIYRSIIFPLLKPTTYSNHNQSYGYYNEFYAHICILKPDLAVIHSALEFQGPYGTVGGYLCRPLLRRCQPSHFYYYKRDIQWPNNGLCERIGAS